LYRFINEFLKFANRVGNTVLGFNPNVVYHPAFATSGKGSFRALDFRLRSCGTVPQLPVQAATSQK